MVEQTHPQQLIDRIIYLASLVSEPRSVDSTLDKLRAITAKTTEPSPQDVEVLQSIVAELEDYLTQHERLRSFTKETLRQNVERHFAVENPERKARRSALRQISVTIIACALVTATPAALGLMKGQIVLAFFIFTLFFGLALIFQSIKKDLVAQLHGSVNYLMAGTIGTGLIALNFPVISELKLDHLFFFQHGGFLEMAIPVYVFYYLAFYLYAKQLNVSIPRVLRPVGASILAVLLAAILLFIPHPVAVPDELFYHLALVGFGVGVYFSGIAAILGFMTVPKTTALYSKTMLFLSISMVLQTIGNANFTLFVTYLSGDFFVNDQKGQILTALLIMGALAFQFIAAFKSKTSLSS